MTSDLRLKATNLDYQGGGWDPGDRGPCSFDVVDEHGTIFATAWREFTDSDFYCSCVFPNGECQGPELTECDIDFPGHTAAQAKRDLIAWVHRVRLRWIAAGRPDSLPPAE